LGGGRIAGYGYDILSGFTPYQTRIVDTNTSPSTQPNHRPVFKRVLSWLVSGDPTTDLTKQSAANLNIAWSSLPTYTTSGTPIVTRPYAAKGLDALNIPFTSLACDPLSAPVEDCAKKAQLVVIGALDLKLVALDLQGKLNKDYEKIINTQLVRIKEIVKAQIPILYLKSHLTPGGYRNDYAMAISPLDLPVTQRLQKIIGGNRITSVQIKP
jgi:Immunomodulating metalloprotease N-terminal domain